MIFNSLPIFYPIITIFWALFLSVFINTHLLPLWFLYTGCFLLFLLTTSWQVLLFCWEAVSILSFLLIYNKDSLSALQINILGGLSLFCGIYFQNNWLIMIAILIKSAQFPFSFWLYQVSSAPHYMSAFFHSVTLVQCGILLLHKTIIVFSDLQSQVLFSIAIFNCLKILFFPGLDKKQLLVDITSLMLSFELMIFAIWKSSLSLKVFNFWKCCMFTFLPFLSQNAYIALLRSSVSALSFEFFSYSQYINNYINNLVFDEFIYIAAIFLWCNILNLTLLRLQKIKFIEFYINGCKSMISIILIYIFFYLAFYCIYFVHEFFFSYYEYNTEILMPAVLNIIVYYASLILLIFKIIFFRNFDTPVYNTVTLIILFNNIKFIIGLILQNLIISPEIILLLVCVLQFWIRYKALEIIKFYSYIF